MNLCTNKIKKARKNAQDLANIRGRAVIIFFPANYATFWAESCPGWHEESEWLKKKAEEGARIFYPDPAYKGYRHAPIPSYD